LTLSPPEVRLQLAALILAEELNFTRAAERLTITQPALSKQIVELENKVGFSVFKRNQKRVELTNAGQVFIRSLVPDSSKLLILWLRGLDLNQRPLGYEGSHKLILRDLVRRG
jgi:hypothetical protein